MLSNSCQPSHSFRKNDARNFRVLKETETAVLLIPWSVGGKKRNITWHLFTLSPSPSNHFATCVLLHPPIVRFFWSMPLCSTWLSKIMSLGNCLCCYLLTSRANKQVLITFQSFFYFFFLSAPQYSFPKCEGFPGLMSSQTFSFWPFCLRLGWNVGCERINL